MALRIRVLKLCWKMAQSHSLNIQLLNCILPSNDVIPEFRRCIQFEKRAEIFNIIKKTLCANGTHGRFCNSILKQFESDERQTILDGEMRFKSYNYKVYTTHTYTHNNTCAQSLWQVRWKYSRKSWCFLGKRFIRLEASKD